MARANKPATPESPQSATAAGSDDIRTRIATERERLAAEEGRELQMMQDRLPPLEAGDDAALDDVERRISDSRAAQLRIQERIGLLTSRLTEAEQREERARVEALRAQADKAREIGEREIREGYAVHAAALAASLRRLRAIDDFIERTNRALETAGVEGVASPNNIRGRPSRTEIVTKKRRLAPNDFGHPCYGKGIAFPRPPDNAGPDWNGEFAIGHGVTATYYVEIEEEERIRHSACWQSRLYEAIEELPSATADEWPKLYTHAENSRGDAAILAELGLAQGDGHE